MSALLLPGATDSDMSQLYHVLHSGGAKKPSPPVPPKPASISAKKNSVKVSGAASAVAPTPTSAPTDKFKEKRVGAGTGSDVRLTQCPRCKRFADKYVEHDFVVLFIDLVLVKPQNCISRVGMLVPQAFTLKTYRSLKRSPFLQVYRHLLFNRLSPSSRYLDPSIVRLGALLLLFDVYITWSHIESLRPELTSSSRITHLPVLLQYCFFLFLCLSTTLSQHLTVRILAVWLGLCGDGEGTMHEGTGGDQAGPEAAKEGSRGASSGGLERGPMPSPKRPSTNAISTALFVSSCMSLFPILMVVWRYDDTSTATISPPPLHHHPNETLLADPSVPSSGTGMDWVRRGVNWIVAVQNFEALRILLGGGYLGTIFLVMAGGVSRWLIRTLILGAAGLGEAG